jgi:hypothetical protein
MATIATGKVGILVLPRAPCYSMEQSVNEMITAISHNQMMFTLGGKNIMDPDQTVE